MKIGYKVKSKLYSNKGLATIIGFNELFNNTYVELVYPNGETISTLADDLIFLNDPVSKLSSNIIDKPEEFLAKYAKTRIESTLTERALISSINYKIQPLPHQLLVVDFVMSRFRPRCLIADEVGLGKTIEAILVYQELKLRGIAKRILIVVPSGLVIQWQEELRLKFSEKFVVFTKDHIRHLKQTHGEETNIWTLADQIIVSIDSIKPYRIGENLESQEEARRLWHNQNVFDDIATAGFDIVIFDEAHKLTKKSDGSESARFKLGKALSDSVPILLLLTATPHQGDEGLFINLLKLIDPVLFKNRNSLKPEIVREVSVRNQKRAVVDFDGNRVFKHRITSIFEIKRTVEQNADELQLYDLVTEYTEKFYNLARRRNDQILIFLIMLYQRITSSSSFAVLSTLKRRKQVLESSDYIKLALFEIESEEFEFADDEILKAKIWERKEDIEAEMVFIDKCISIAEQLTKTFADQKFKELINLIDEIKRREKNPDLKFIIFTEFRATQDAIITYLKKFGYDCAYINGSLSQQEKVDQTEIFKNQLPMLVSTDAGGEGINLQFCHCMINFDLPWNPTRIEQRIGRIDRIGQKKNVLIFNFHLIDTIEDQVRQILEAKLERIKKQFGEDKYADVINLLHDEFSFDKIYLDALRIKDKESKEFEKQAKQIYNRAKEILSKDDLLIPFTKPEDDPNELLNRDCNKLIKSLVFNFLKSKSIELYPYKSGSDMFYFENPFRIEGKGISSYRNIVFDYESAANSEKSEFMNVEHPFIKKIDQELNIDNDYGMVSAFRLKLNKFMGISGFWFNYQLTIRNNIDKKYIIIIPVFMEDDKFCNSRIGNYLSKTNIDKYELIQNLNVTQPIELIEKEAAKIIKQNAMDIFYAKKIEWDDEIENYRKRLEEYFQYKQDALKTIPIENIRKVRVEKNLVEKQKELGGLERKKLIFPKIELLQIAYVEFV